jgi:hypothetical protein
MRRAPLAICSEEKTARRPGASERAIFRHDVVCAHVTDVVGSAAGVLADIAPEPQPAL